MKCANRVEVGQQRLVGYLDAIFREKKDNKCTNLCVEAAFGSHLEAPEPYLYLGGGGDLQRFEKSFEELGRKRCSLLITILVSGRPAFGHQIPVTTEASGGNGRPDLARIPEVNTPAGGGATLYRGPTPVRRPTPIGTDGQAGTGTPAGYDGPF